MRCSPRQRDVTLNIAASCVFPAGDSVRVGKAERSELSEQDEQLAQSRVSQYGCNELVDVRLGEMRTEEHEGRQAKLAAFDAHEQGRKPANQARAVEASEGCALTHAELTRAEVEHGRARGTEVQISLLDFDQVNEQARGEPMPFETDRSDTRNELVVGQSGECHCVLGIR